MKANTKKVGLLPHTFWCGAKGPGVWGKRPRGVGQNAHIKILYKLRGAKGPCRARCPWSNTYSKKLVHSSTAAILKKRLILGVTSARKRPSRDIYQIKADEMRIMNLDDAILRKLCEMSGPCLKLPCQRTNTTCLATNK